MRSTSTLLAVSIWLTSTSNADAACDQSAASDADIELFQAQECGQPFTAWHIQAYSLDASHWTNRGWAGCDIKLEYTKHRNAAYLITYALTESGEQFHGTLDYRRAAEAAASEFHGSLDVTIRDGSNFSGTYEDGVLTTYCPLYDAGVYFANPASRSGTFIHEGWHAWLEKYNFDNGPSFGHHGPTGRCKTQSCDYFYFHKIGDYEFGHMWEQDGTANRFHSPIQVQVEYLCDLALNAESWVPALVTELAQNESNSRAIMQFINGPGYACGDAAP
jgi:hypothetical protein